MNTVQKPCALAATRADPARIFVCDPPTSEAHINNAEHILGVRLPSDVHAALRECDGMGKTLGVVDTADPRA